MMTIKILGAGSATPSIGRYPSSMVVISDSNSFLIDCGEGTQWRLLEYGVKTSKINHIFISHLHGDHYLGLVGLLSTMNSLGRKKDLCLYAPKGLKEILILQFKCQDTRINFEIILHETDVNNNYILFEDNFHTVETIPLNHRVPTCGFLFREKIKARNLIKHMLPALISLQHIQQLKIGDDIYDETGRLLYKNSDLTYDPDLPKSFAYCSDTCYDERIAPFIEKVDLLYHESTFLDDKIDRAAETCHSTASQAAAIAFKANVKKLILGHFSARYKHLQPFLDEAKPVFANTELALGGIEFQL